jgi:hypothetical protein
MRAITAKAVIAAACRRLEKNGHEAEWHTVAELNQPAGAKKSPPPV